MENLRGQGMYLGAPRTDVQRLCSIGIRWQESTLVVFSLTMAPWLVLLFPWSVLAFELTDNGDSMIMKAIMSQIVISLQRDYKQATEIRNTDKTRVKEVPSRGSPPLEVFLDNWIRIIKKRQHGFSKQEKKARGTSKVQERLTKIIKKRGNMDFQNRRRRTKAPTGRDGQRETFGCWNDC